MERVKNRAQKLPAKGGKGREKGRDDVMSCLLHYWTRTMGKVTTVLLQERESVHSVTVGQKHSL